jgi:UDP-N-acetylglucosamine 2-epimerase (non-hydrolysing)
MRRFEPVLAAERPAAVLVVGDVNSTVACALVAAKEQASGRPRRSGIAQLRPRDARGDQPGADRPALGTAVHDGKRRRAPTCLREGIADHRIRFVGNVMIDSLARKPRARRCPRPSSFAAMAAMQIGPTPALPFSRCIARPTSTIPMCCSALLGAIREISADVPVVFPVHPRTRATISRHGLDALLDSPSILQLPPAGYLEMLGLMQAATLVLTDSGGIQEETTALGIPCITLRDNTERPGHHRRRHQHAGRTGPGAHRRADARDPGHRRQARAGSRAVGRMRREADRRIAARMARRRAPRPRRRQR